MVGAGMRGLPPGIPRRRPSPTTVANGPRTHTIIALLKNYGQSQRAISEEFGISPAAVWLIGQRAELHETYETALDDRPGPLAHARTWKEQCGFCLAWRTRAESGHVDKYGSGKFKPSGGFEYSDWNAASVDRQTA